MTRTQQYREQARQLYGSEDIHVPQFAWVDESPAEGAWVTARLWVPNDSPPVPDPPRNFYDLGA